LFHIGQFGLTFDAPVFTSVNAWALMLSTAAAVAIFRFKIGMIPVLVACSLAGLGLYLTSAIA